MPNELNNKTKKGCKQGFTLVEVLVGTAVFLVIALASYQVYMSVFKIVSANQFKILALNLMNERFEVIRNMPYDDIGISGGLPSGVIPYEETLVRGGVGFVVTATVRNIDHPQDGQIGSTTNNDLSPADNKLVSLTISCGTCVGFTPLTLDTNVAPKNLETASTNGALFIRVFDANGQPIQGADVTVENNSATPSILIQDVTNAEGLLQLVDVAPGANVYEISVTKDGYSTDQTYPLGDVNNPSPDKPHATVALQQVTQISFQIDRLSTINLSTVTPTCTAVPSVDLDLTSLKTIGTDVPKYDVTHITNASGIKTINNIEWGTYEINGVDGTYDVIGLNPLNPFSINPDSVQNLQVIVKPTQNRTLLVTVKDSSTLLPIPDALVTFEADYSGGYTDEVAYTGIGSINQTDWSGGNGQDDYTDSTMYFEQDGNIEDSNSGSLNLFPAFGTYSSTGALESSTFDTGGASNFHSLIWNPVDQPALSGAGSLSFQLASNEIVTPTTTWSYIGPDGTNGSWYTTSNTNIYSGHDDDRYLRYKVYMSTATATVTPVLNDVSFTFTSDCVPPGQVYFDGLPAGDYILNVGKSGYATSTFNIDIDSNWQEQEVILAP